MLPQTLTIVDVETTGLSPLHDRVIEIGILRVENQKIIKTYQTLINPEVYISPHISDFTGISEKDLKDAPLFEDIYPHIADLFEESIFVAHNARFDYAFLKNEYRRLGKTLQLKQLCTVKLSRALYPHYSRHNLDAICERFNIVCKRRHRAFDDARVLWDFIMHVQNCFPQDTLERVTKLILKKPSLPAHISYKEVDTIPQSPGVYIFYGKDQSVLYVGKSKNLKDRVLSHFSSDYLSGKDMQISQQIYSIETIATSGELSALIKESFLIKKLQPFYNRKLRQSRKMVILRQRISSNGYLTASLSEEGEIDPQTTEEIIGIFKSKRQAKDYLLSLAKEYGLCRKLLGLEKTNSSCFGYRLDSCSGACIGEIHPLSYNAKCITAFSEKKVKKWPFAGPVIIKELDIDSEKEGGYVIDKWCILGEWTPDTPLEETFPSEYTFDVDTYKILLSYLKDPLHAAKISVLGLPVKEKQKAVEVSHMSHVTGEDFEENEQEVLGF